MPFPGPRFNLPSPHLASCMLGLGTQHAHRLYDALLHCQCGCGVNEPGGGKITF